MPGSLLSRYSPLPGNSVPFCWVTRYCSGESIAIASGSLLNVLISFSLNRTCIDRSRLEGDVFAFKKIIQTRLPAQTTRAALLEAAFFELVVDAGPIVDP